jgi:hypothetical protein
MLTAALLTALSIAPAPAQHQGWLLAQGEVPLPSQSVSDREATIKALRDEKADLEDQKASVGYAFPIVLIIIGGGFALITPIFHYDSTSLVPPVLYVGGSLVATIGAVLLIYRIVHSVSLSHQISEKENQIEQLSQQRFQPVVLPLPRGGAMAGFAYAF